MPDVGVLVMAYGTPARPEDVEAYYTHIRRGRPPAPEQLADLVRRYDAIGGISPLAERTRAQVDGIQRALDELAPDRYEVVLGMKHAAPFIEDAVAELRERDLLEGAVLLVLAPHYSALSVGDYLGRAREAAGDLSATLHAIEHWYEDLRFTNLLAGRVLDARTRFDSSVRVRTLFTAHSLPERVLQMGDPYPDQLRETAEAVAVTAHVDDWALAWQSAGRTPEPWLGPDILDVIRALGGAGEHDGVLVCPAGFTSDHLEVLYDIDIEAAAVARHVGLQLERTASLNDDPQFCTLLAELVHTAAG